MTNSRDWIECIIEEVLENYNGRKIVLWGKYSVSDQIKQKLKEKHGIKTAFYVDKDEAKIDNRAVFSTSCLQGKSEEYYVVVPVAYYQSLKDELDGGGYIKETDYSYFCDCSIVEQNSNYYEDSHGNKVIGTYGNMKFVFSGFNSVIRIGENANINNNNEFYVHSNSIIEIGENVKLSGNKFCVQSNSKLGIGNNTKIDRSIISLDKCSEAGIGAYGIITKFRIFINENAQLKIGNRFELDDGYWSLCKYALLNIRDRFSILCGCRWEIGTYTTVLIKEDCMFSFDNFLRSRDSHSIFDVNTGRNINSTEEICKTRKIVIGNHVWVGARTIILYNTEIGDGSIIGAGSLVKGKIPNNCIAAGVSAKVIRKDIAWSRNDGADELMERENQYARLTEEE